MDWRYEVGQALSMAFFIFMAILSACAALGVVALVLHATGVL